MENWVTIKGHPTYEISSYGRVRNKKTSTVLRARVNRRGGYLRVRLDGKECFVHRLVFDNFIENGCKCKDVIHADGDHFNNNLANLESKK